MSYGQNANRAYFGDLDHFVWRLWETWWNQGGQVKTKGAPEHNSLKKLLIYSSRAWSNISSLTWPPYSCYMTTCSFFYSPKGNLDSNSGLNPYQLLFHPTHVHVCMATQNCCKALHQIQILSQIILCLKP